MEKYYIFFSKLANKTKMKIVLSLRQKEKSVLELVRDTGIEQSKLSHALATMRCCSIVQVRREGKKRMYRLNKDTIVPILDIIDKHESKYCEGKCPLADKEK